MVKEKKWDILFSNRAQQEAKKIKAVGLKGKIEELLDILENNPLQYPPKYKRLTGDLNGFYSRRINLQHRLVYSLDEDAMIVYVISMFDHY